MKISTGRTFDAGQLIQSFKTAGIKGAEEFVTYIQDFSNQVVNAIRGTLTFEENFNCIVKVLDLKHNTRLAFEISGLNTKKQPKHIWVTRSYPIENAPLSFSWQILQNGTVEVLATFVGTPTSTVQTTLVILF